MKIIKKVPLQLIFMCLGALCALPTILPALWFLSWIALVAFFLLEHITHIHTPSFKKSWIQSFCFFCGSGLTTFHWFLAMPPLDYAGLSYGLSWIICVFAWILIPILQAIPFACILPMTHFTVKKVQNRVVWICVPAFLWMFCEWLQSLGNFNLPWNTLAIGQVGCLPIIQIASLVGASGISFIMVLCSRMIAQGILTMRKSSFWNKSFSGALLIIVFVFSFGFLNTNKINSSSAENTIKVAAVQGNIQTPEKWALEPEETLIRQQELILAAAKENPDLIVLSETAIPYVANVGEYLPSFFETLSKKLNTNIAIGCFYKENEKIYNAVRYVTPNGYLDDVYFKQNLVPFGEHIPSFLKALPVISQLNLFTNDIACGKESTVSLLDEHKVGTLICFDSIYPENARMSVQNGTEIFLLPTNDCWFKDSAALNQHLSHAVLRAVETGRCIVRVANTGKTVVISASGRVIDSLPIQEEGVLVADVNFNFQNTLYSTSGNLLIPIGLLFLALWLRKIWANTSKHNEDNVD